jgi:EmrB/QacA subfamily drug resistance transporter
MFSITEQNRKWWILAAMTASLSLIFIDQTALSVALPPLQRELNLSNIALQWIMNAYLLALATLVVFGGKLGDLISHRKTFLVGITLFTASCLTCALANSGLSLIISRTLQGIGGAFMIPATSAILIRAFPDAERGKAIGIYVGVASLFLATGPIFGGLLTQYLNWRWVFWLNLPPAFIAISLMLMAHPKADANDRVQIDWLGFGLFTAAILSLIFALMEAVNWGWSSIYILGLLVASGILLTTFLKRTKQHPSPFIELSLFRQSSFLYSSLILLLIQTAGMSLVFWVIFLQDVLHFTPDKSGLATLPIMLPLMFMAPIGGTLRDKYGPRLPMLCGALLGAIGIAWIGYAANTQSYAWIFPGFLLYGIGVPLIISNCTATGLSGVQRSQHGLASGLLSGARQLGNCLGIAIISSALLGLNHYYLNKFLQQTPHTFANITAKQLDGLLAGTDKALQTIAHFSIADTQVIYNIATSAYVAAFSHTMYLMAFLILACCFMTFKIPNKLHMSSGK